MDGNGVSQDSSALREVASSIMDYDSNFNKFVEELYTKLSNNLTDSEAEGSAWWGPNASAFRLSVENKKPEFEKAYKDIKALADNLNEQADSWDTFENKG